MLLYLLFKPRTLWKIWSEQKCEGAFHSGAATRKVCSIRPRKFPEIHTGIFGRLESTQNIVIPEMTSEAKSSHSPLFLALVVNIENGNFTNFENS